MTLTRTTAAYTATLLFFVLHCAVLPARATPTLPVEVFLPSESPAYTPEASSVSPSPSENPADAPETLPDSGNDETNPQYPSITPSTSPAPPLYVPASQDNSPACFPGSAIVTLVSGEIKPMRDLQVGDVVSVGEGKFSPVYFFSHRVGEGQFGFVKVHTDKNKTITLSRSHYLLVENRLVSANAIAVGDKLKDASGNIEVVVQIEKNVTKTGLFNPHTLADTIVVDGIEVSVFTASIYPPLARMLLAPLKVAYRLGFRGVLQRIWDDGKPELARWVLAGSSRMGYTA